MQLGSDNKTQSWLSWFSRGILIFGFLVMLGRLIELQVIKGNYYQELAEGNRIRRVPIQAPRGKILARGGEILVGSKEIKKRVVFNPQKGFEKLDNLEGANEEEILTEWERDYPLGSKFAHVSGYVGLVDEEEVGKVNPNCPEKGIYLMHSWIGRTGLEEKYECILGGIDGEELIEVDTTGNFIRILGRRNPIPGSDIKTSINYSLQNKLADILEKKSSVPKELMANPKDYPAASVVTDTKGQILALHSHPSYDPNLLVNKNNEKIKLMFTDPNLPFFNRVIAGAYHPGSTFKPLMLMAALEEGSVDEDFRYTDTGSIEIKTMYGDFSYRNWYYTQYGRTEGEIGILKAMARSTDTFFYKMGEVLGVEKIVEWSRNFGLDEKTQIDLPGEVEGLIPDPKWKERVKGERWFLGNTYHISIGQGDLAITPIELNTLISTIANSGERCSPSIAGNSECKNLNLAEKNISLVKQGMSMACTQGGTGFTFFDFNPKDWEEDNRVACKTGTAETAGDKNTHAWFVAFAPVDIPEIVTTVLVEHGGEGSKIAGPITREIFDFWFNR